MYQRSTLPRARGPSALSALSALAERGDPSGRGELRWEEARRDCAGLEPHEVCATLLQVIWIRLGNCSSPQRKLFECRYRASLRQHGANIQNFCEDSIQALLVVP
jgi:hypothetical protein